MTNSQGPSASAAAIFSAKCNTAQGLLYEESPRFMVTQSFGGGQSQLLGDLCPVQVTLMAEVELGGVRLCWCQRGGFCGFHAGIKPRMVYEAKPKNAAAA